MAMVIWRKPKAKASMDKLSPLQDQLKDLSSDGCDEYREFARPLMGKLLSAMELSKNYLYGQGDYLYYDKNQKIQKILDLTGGYGANLLGHRHPRLIRVVQEWNDKGAPSLTQGSVRKASGLLAKKISDILSSETSEGPWITTLSNSGTEAIEAAMKHCLLHYNHKLIELTQEIEKEINLSTLKIRRADPATQVKTLMKLRSEMIKKTDHLKMSEERRSYVLHQVANAQDIEDLVSLIREINTLQLKEKPKFMALEKAYHGKTLGALSLTHKESFRQDFFLGEEYNTQTIFISAHGDLNTFQEVINSTKRDLIYLTASELGVHLVKHSFSILAGAFAEPIQGEAGIIPVSSNTLGILKKFSLQENFLLVFDEIQTGMFRTGLMAAAHHSHITADIYTFSKSLGGGIAKIAATTVIKRKYIEEFGLLHSSTFAEDDFSSLIALEVLTILEEEGSPVSEGIKTADYLWTRLDWIHKQYPGVINDLRGQGMLLSLEFHSHLFKDMGTEFKPICDNQMQGFLMASALLNHENLRMNPSLSNNYTLRIQPSLYFTIIQVEELLAGLTNMCEALTQKNVKYFLSALYADGEIQNIQGPNLTETIDLGKRPLSVFLCHMIDEHQIQSVTEALKLLQPSKLTEKLSLTKEVTEFQIYHAQTIKDNIGREMDIILLGGAITSEDLKNMYQSKNKYRVIQKIQNAVDYAKKLGASTVGLGQFTSIVSGNGLYLNPRGMNLTTGNAYTIGLTIQSALRSAQEKNKVLQSSTAALLGAAGNIMSVASSIMADHVGKIILIHHTSLEESPKFQEALKRILGDIASSESETLLVKAVKAHYKASMDLLSFLDIPEVKDRIVATGDLNLMKEADIVLSGTSSSSGFLTLDLFKQDSVIVDIAVPSTVRKDLLKKIKTDRPDIVYHLGGIAQVPHQQSLSFPMFPLKANQSYACMAETFSIGFSGQMNYLNIGDLNKAIVKDVEKLAHEAGFILGSNKTKNSF